MLTNKIPAIHPKTHLYCGFHSYASIACRYGWKKPDTLDRYLYQHHAFSFDGFACSPINGYCKGIVDNGILFSLILSTILAAKYKLYIINYIKIFYIFKLLWWKAMSGNNLIMYLCFFKVFISMLWFHVFTDS